MAIPSQLVLDAARAAGFELYGLTRAVPHAHHARHMDWCEQGLAAGMQYLTDHRAQVRSDPRLILPEAQTMLCVGKLYQTRGPLSHAEAAPGEGWISRYAWGERDYHDVLREGLERLVKQLEATLKEPFTHRICVDTAPLLERSYAREAGLGWIGKNTCLINQPQGSWFFLGEILFSFEVDNWGTPPPDRCGTCTRCIDACPTAAIVPAGNGWQLDANRCISYWTIEAKEAAPEALRAAFGNHIFGCDICQDVCPWNRRAPFTEDPAFQPINATPALDELAALTPEDFRSRFRKTPLARTKHSGLERNVAIARQNLKDRSE